MPDIFLSPSTQEYNPYYDGGGNEEYYMNIITDEIIPYLDASDLSYGRNDPAGSFLNSVRLSNSEDYALHLALHSNAAPKQSAGRVRGSQVYYYQDSSESKRAAQIFAERIREIYPLPDRVEAVPTTSLGEIVRTKAPAVLIEIAYHDNPEDAEWIRDNLDEIAQVLALGIGEYLGRNINEPSEPVYGTVTTQGGRLNLRAEPTVNSDIRASVPNGTRLRLLSRSGDWFYTEYKGIRGYVFGSYIRADDNR